MSLIYIKDQVYNMYIIILRKYWNLRGPPNISYKEFLFTVQQFSGRFEYEGEASSALVLAHLSLRQP